MTTVNTIELKTHANQLLNKVSGKHQMVLITRHGRPCAALVPVTEENLIDLVWEFSPEIQKRLQTSVDELRAGKGESLKSFAKRHGLA